MADARFGNTTRVEAIRVQFIFSLLAVLIAFGIGSGPSQASPVSRYVGRWAVQSGSFNVVILDVSTTADGAAIIAALQSPQNFELYPKGNGVRAISGAYERQTSTAVKVLGDALDIRLVNSEKPSDTSEIHLTLFDDDHGEIRFVGSPVVSVPVTRVGLDQEPYMKWQTDRAYSISDKRPSNTAMTALFNADQTARRKQPIDWDVVGKEDEQRRATVRELLANGQVHTGEDYFHAAFIFQHSDLPRDYILAHTLAMVAAVKRQPGALWIASATLDRYLQSIGQPQIYGTQFKHGKDGTVTQDPIDRTVVSDELRRELDVGTLGDQEAMRAKMEAPALSKASHAPQSKH